MSTALVDDLGVKRSRVLNVAAARGADGVLLRSAAAVNWYLDGARTHVSLAADPLVHVLVSQRDERIFVTNNETARLLSEELPTGITVEDRRWDAVARSVLGSTDQSTGLILDEADVEVDLRRARAAMLPGESARFAGLGAECASVLTDALTACDPADTERQLAGRLAGDLASRSIDPLVILVAGADRLAWRHPLPTAGPLGRRVMATLCGRRNGLIMNVTRWVTFGPLTSDEESANRRIMNVEAAYFSALVPGSTLGEVFAAGTAAYADQGFRPDEWEQHHQGGAAGYHGRDPRATMSSDDPIVIGQAFTWNPSAPGVKVEDTVMLGAGGLSVLSVDPRWPTVLCSGLARPDILRR